MNGNVVIKEPCTLNCRRCGLYFSSQWTLSLAPDNFVVPPLSRLGSLTHLHPRHEPIFYFGYWIIRSIPSCKKLFSHYWKLCSCGVMELRSDVACALCSKNQTRPTCSCKFHVALGYKNSSGDEIANANFYAVRPETTRIR